MLLGLAAHGVQVPVTHFDGSLYTFDTVTRNTKRRLALWTPTIALVLSWWLSPLGPLTWSPINCWHHEVDIYSGRERYTRFIAWIQVKERITDTALTTALSPDDLTHPPKWHRALTFSPGVRHSPHYIYHSALHQIDTLELIWRLADFTPEARRATAREVLRLWQDHGRDDPVRKYLAALDKVTYTESDTRLAIRIVDLPERELYEATKPVEPTGNSSSPSDLIPNHTSD